MGQITFKHGLLKYKVHLWKNRVKVMKGNSNMNFYDHTKHCECAIKCRIYIYCHIT